MVIHLRCWNAKQILKGRKVLLYEIASEKLLGGV